MKNYPNNRLISFYHRPFLRDYYRLISLALSILILVSLALSIYVVSLHNGNFWYGFWFSFLEHFTIQSNVLVLITLLIFIINPALFTSRKNYLLMFAMSYITITFIGYNFLIVPLTSRAAYSFVSSTGKFTLSAAIASYNSIVFHLLTPVIFVSLFLVYCKQQLVKPLFRYKVVLLGLIYPLVYLTYALLISIFKVNVVYNGFTNVNPCYTFGQKPGKIFNLVYYAVFSLLFALLLYTYPTYSNWMMRRYFRVHQLRH